MLDNYGRKITYLRLSVTQLCNLRCRYCMPAGGICKKDHGEMLTQEEMLWAVRSCASLGVSKVRITGGEPLVKKNIVSICEQTANVQGIEEVCLTTNGVMLPQLAADLKRAGVKRINLSLDTLNKHKYSYITRIGELDRALEGLDAALNAGFEKVKINTVLIGGFNDDEISDLANLTMKYPVDVRFIELMPMYDSGDFGSQAYVSGRKVLEVLPQLENINKSDEKADNINETGRLTGGFANDDHGVARLYKLPGAKGCVGLINPLSAHFCSECNRIRITADGKIKPCLHSAEEYSIKGLDEEKMAVQIREAILAKPQWHGELSCVSRSRAGRNMNQIGG